LKDRGKPEKKRDKTIGRNRKDSFAEEKVGVAVTSQEIKAQASNPSES